MTSKEYAETRWRYQCDTDGKRIRVAANRAAEYVEAIENALNLYFIRVDSGAESESYKQFAIKKIAELWRDWDRECEDDPHSMAFILLYVESNLTDNEIFLAARKMAEKTDIYYGNEKRRTRESRQILAAGKDKQ